MKRFILLTIFSLSFLAIHSQTKICGIYWGANYNFAKPKLEQKFGKCDVSASDENKIVFNSQQYAGIHFDYLSFSFQREGTSSHMNSCTMGIVCKTVEEAKSKRDYIASVVSAQYSLNSAIGEDGFKYYYGGSDPTNSIEYAFMIDATELAKGVYFAYIKYGPYNFTKEKF